LPGVIYNGTVGVDMEQLPEPWSTAAEQAGVRISDALGLHCAELVARAESAAR